MVGATGSGPFAAELLGSTADRVLRKATSPVLVVRGELRVPPRRVLAPVDLSPLSSDAFRCGLDVLAQLAKSAEVEVRAVYASSLKDIAAPRRRKLSERPADLVMLGTHGRGGMDRLMLGSVASMVARQAPCSVLMISPEAALAAGIAEAITSLTTPAWHGGQAGASH